MISLSFIDESIFSLRKAFSAPRCVVDKKLPAPHVVWIKNHPHQSLSAKGMKEKVSGTFSTLLLTCADGPGVRVHGQLKGIRKAFLTHSNLGWIQTTIRPGFDDIVIPPPPPQGS